MGFLTQILAFISASPWNSCCLNNSVELEYFTFVLSPIYIIKFWKRSWKVPSWFAKWFFRNLPIFSYIAGPPFLTRNGVFSVIFNLLNCFSLNQYYKNNAFHFYTQALCNCIITFWKKIMESSFKRLQNFSMGNIISQKILARADHFYSKLK